MGSIRIPEVELTLVEWRSAMGKPSSIFSATKSHLFSPYALTSTKLNTSGVGTFGAFGSEVFRSSSSENILCMTVDT